MIYTKLEVSPQVVHDVLLSYLRENSNSFVIPPPISNQIAPDRHWFEATREAGKPLNELIDAVFNQLTVSDMLTREEVPVDDSTVMNAYNAYFPLQIKKIILEEILELIRFGVLFQGKYQPKAPNQNFDFSFDFTHGTVMLTEFGVKFLADEQSPPHYSTKQFLERLSQYSEPDEELKTYLSEGLTCLRHHLNRAAAILLRLAAEHMLQQLIQSTEKAISQKAEREKFISYIRKAGIRIEERAEVIFRKLEASSALLPSSGYCDEVANRLRASFHSIRTLGGKASHTSAKIQMEEVIDHYSLFASSVYPIIVKIIEYHATLVAP